MPWPLFSHRRPAFLQNSFWLPAVLRPPGSLYGLDDADTIPPSLNWPLFLHLVRRHRVAGLTARASAGNRPDCIPQDVWDQLQQEWKAGARLSFRLAAESTRLAARLAEASVAVIFLKGAALSQRRQLGEISAAEELAQAIGIADRKRAIEVSTAQQQLALLRKNHADNYTAIDTAERAITEMQAKHTAERQKERDAAALAAQQRAKQLAALDISASTSKGNDGVAAREENLSFGKQMGTVTGSDEIAELRAIAEQKIQIRREELEATLQNGQIEEAERKRLNTELVGLERQRSLDMSKIDHQESLNRLAEIRSYTEPFTSATTMMTQGFIQGTLTRQQLAQRAAQSIAISYANMGAKVVTDWFNTNVAMAAWDRLFGAQEVAQTVATQNGVTSAKAAGASAQTGVVIAGQEAEAGAVAAGESAKTTAQAAGASEGLLIKAGAAVKSVAISAYEAAAGAYSAIASIPYVGPVLAPVAAAGALAAVFAIGRNIASAEGGWGEVPEDGSPAVLHKKEMVLPAQFAVPLRAMLTEGGGTMPRYGMPSFLNRPIGGDATTTRPGADSAAQSGASTTVNFNVSAVDAAGVQAFFNANAGRMAATVGRYFQNNPSSRPKY